MNKRVKPCWRGAGDTAPYVAGVPETVSRFRSLPALFREMACCTRCELAPGRTQVVHGVGDPAARLLFLGEAPGKQEDARGEPFVGQAGRLFDQLLAGIGLERSQVFITNVVACRPPANRTPRPAEVRAHAPWLEEQLRLVDPDVIVTLGRVALTYFLPRGKVTELRGKPLQVVRSGRTVTLIPLLHPAAVLRNRREMLPRMEQDFAQVAKAVLDGRAG